MSTATHDLARYQEALPVRLIETPRKDFVFCKPDETLGTVRARNTLEAFDHLPVKDEEGRVIGVLHIAMLDAQPDQAYVGSCHVPIGEHLLMGAEVSILEFLQDADQRPFRFLVTTDGISGLVSLSDIQRLPVRAALFAIITQFEMAMARLIDARFPDDAWKEHLGDKRFEKIEGERAKASRTRNQVARLLYTQFVDKLEVLAHIAKDRGISDSQKKIKAEFKRFEKLRNALAHANLLGVTRDDANVVIQNVREIQGWIDWIERTLQEIGNQNQ